MFTETVVTSAERIYVWGSSTHPEYEYKILSTTWEDNCRVASVGDVIVIDYVVPLAYLRIVNPEDKILSIRRALNVFVQL